MIKICNFKYSTGVVPDGYECQDCGAFSVRLYREYNTFMEGQHLRCRACAMKNQSKSNREFDDTFNSKEHSIGWLVAAVPTEDGESFWGFTSVPDDGVEWWDNLPKELIKTEIQ